MTLTQVTRAGLDSEALDHTYTLGAIGTDHYTFTGEGLTGAANDPTLYLTRGKTYKFINGNSSGAHPFRIQSVAGAGGTIYNTGVTNNAGGGGTTITFEVPHDAPDVLYYICTSHASMNGIFYMAGSTADGTITTAKLADDAVDADKLANSINTEIAANTAKTTNATHTGEVTGATALTIADDVVDEANLKVSNTPTNGYFLSAQSGNTGGLTWANVDLTALSASNLTSGTIPDARLPATLPAISGANLTGISAGITMADQWRIYSTQSNTYGNAHITANWERNDNSTFTGIGSAMTESSGTFTFPVTGIYLIRGIAQYQGQNDVHNQNERQHLGLILMATTNNSSYNEISKCRDSSGNKYGIQSHACVVTETIFDVTDVTTHKIRMHHDTVGSAYLMGESGVQMTGITFIKLGDT
tara:strand:+ start:1009 stop:2256 length:1248 start_codon:yes stop_codon:yes gene_type:complete